MRRLSYPGIKLPCVYVTNDDAEVVMLRESGIPFIRTSDDNDRVVLCVLYHWLRKRFPHIDWRRQLGLGFTVRSYMVHVPGRTASRAEAEGTRRMVEEAGGDLDLPYDDADDTIDDDLDPTDDETLDEEGLREHIRKTLRAAQGCELEFTQRDVYTINHDEEKVRRFIAIIREEIANHWKP